MYNALNGSTQLTGWRIGGGDPCGESWKGVTCEGSAVVSMYEIHVILQTFNFLILYFFKCVYYCQGFISYDFVAILDIAGNCGQMCWKPCFCDRNRGCCTIVFRLVCGREN